MGVAAAGLASRLQAVQADGCRRRPAPFAAGPARASELRTLALGYAGVYSSFLRHAEVAAKTHNLKTVNNLVELRRRKMAGGQEDMIVDVTMDLFKRGVHDSCMPNQP